MPDLQAPIDLLRACAGQARRVGASVSPLADRFSATDDAVGRHRGFGSARALEACRLAWSSRIREDAAEAGRAGGLLAETAGSYHRADAEAAVRLRRVHDELPL